MVVEPEASPDGRGTLFDASSELTEGVVVFLCFAPPRVRLREEDDVLLASRFEGGGCVSCSIGSCASWVPAPG